MNQEQSAYIVSTPTQLASVLRTLRRLARLNQTDVGRLLGVNQKRISLIEASPERTSFEQISRMVTALGGRLVIETAFSPDETNEDPSDNDDTTPSVWLL